MRGVCLIPASGEFAYAGEPVMRRIGFGEEIAENRHTQRAATDLEAALDDLESGLPACRSVALVTSWFGTDLRCADCEIRPGVETRQKDTRPLVWRAADETRATAWLVSRIEDGPAYGGTPSDETVISAIKALKARGYEVTLYPFILMDIAAGNGLPDPYGGVEQPAFPWRGRISCHPAPGRPGTPDKTAAADAQIDLFFGSAQASDFAVGDSAVTYSGPAEWGFNRFILHHAALAVAAGGVECVVIGSEMRGLTQVRSAAASYPAVTRLRQLAAEVRALVGPAVTVTYAADWSEYSGHQPEDGSGDRNFHLDPLWADPVIDCIGVDWYAPLADWRDGMAHLDALDGAASIHDVTYLAANVEGGEGFDWYYASPEDRMAQIRTPITDGAYGEPWVFGYKRLRSWWSLPHHDRIGGVRAPAPTAWTPMSKPVRLMELGCPAVDKGANQPNVFIDPKSSESFAPYFSSASRDDLIQRRYIEALLGYWQTHNPISPIYGGPMIDLAHCQVWTWDARPFPEFPVLDAVWSDGGNWRLGHWLTGRAGQSELARIVRDVAERCGIAELDVSALDGRLAGFVIDRPGTGRAILEPLAQAFGFDLVDRSGGPACLPRGVQPALHLARSELVREGGRPVLRLSRTPVSERPQEVRLGFVRDDGDYSPAVAYARGRDGEQTGVLSLSLRALSDRAQASDWARQLLGQALADVEGAELLLPPSFAALEAGDGVTFDAGRAGAVWRVAGLDGLSQRRAGLRRAVARGQSLSGPEPEGAGMKLAGPSQPVLYLLDLPLSANEADPRSGLVAFAHARPWPGELVISAGVDTDSLTERARLSRPATAGVLTAPLGAGPEGRWDRAGRVVLQLHSGSLASATPSAVFAGANRLAVDTGDGFEVLQFVKAELVGPGQWLLTDLLRGLGGSPVSGAPAGAVVVLLDQAGVVLPVLEHERDAPILVHAVGAGLALNHVSAVTLDARYHAIDERPLRPVHLRERLVSGEHGFSWVRQTRRGGDSWGAGSVPLGEARERYAVQLLDPDGELVESLEVDEATVTLSAALLASLYPTGRVGARWQVAQISEGYGPGVWASAVFEA